MKKNTIIFITALVAIVGAVFWLYFSDLLNRPESTETLNTMTTTTTIETNYENEEKISTTTLQIQNPTPQAPKPIENKKPEIKSGNPVDDCIESMLQKGEEDVNKILEECVHGFGT